MTTLVPISTNSLAEMDEQELIEKIRVAYGATQDFYQKAVVTALLTGALLSHAKATIKHGNFRQWIKESLPEISYDTANRYRKLAEAVKEQKLRGATFDLEQLLQLPQLEAEERDAMLGKLAKATEGKSLKQLYFDFDIVKKPDSKGGSRISSGSEKSETTEEEILEALKDNWETFATTALDYIEDEEMPWTDLPKTDREHLVGILEPFVKKLKASLK